MAEETKWVVPVIGRICQILNARAVVRENRHHHPDIAGARDTDSFEQKKVTGEGNDGSRTAGYSARRLRGRPAHRLRSLKEDRRGQSLIA
jgi:hypothetical protein